jgi:hypothetical protein
MTLTREEILAMEPGRELDKLIAEQVMGWSIYRFDKDVPERCYYMLVDKSFDPVVDDGYWNAGERKTEEEAWNDNRPFSTDISAAWEVVMHLKSKYWYFMLSDENEGWEASFYWDPHRPAFEAVSSDAPQAICKAALLAVLKL